MEQVSLEGIAFQTTDFFDTLASVIREIRKSTQISDLKDQQFFEHDLIKAIARTVKTYTNVNVEICNGIYTGPMVILHDVSSNHIFDRIEKVTYKAIIPESSPNLVAQIASALKQEIIAGHVNLMTGRVDGVFADMIYSLFMPRPMLQGDTFTPEEAAAVILHEVGHILTSFEFLDRTVTTNQVLACLTRTLDGSLDEKQKSVIYKIAGDKLKMTDSERQALNSAKKADSLAQVVIDTSIRLSRSELGSSVYDMVSCEYLADEYATRQRAGRHLVTGLDKVYRQYKRQALGGHLIAVLTITLNILKALFSGLAVAVTIAMIYAIVAVIKADRTSLYDTDHSRLRRIRAQNTQMLKDQNLGTREKRQLIKDNEAIDLIMSSYNDNLSIIEKIAYLVRPEFRRLRKIEVQQKELEQLANNPLFDHAAKLSILKP